MRKPETFEQRMSSARIARKYSQRGLAKLVGLTGSTLSQWEDGTIRPENIKTENLLAIARVLGVRVEWLLSGEEPQYPMSTPADLVVDGARHAAADARQLPVISWVQAGYGVEATDPYPRGHGMDAVGVDAETARELSRVAFALRIEGDSMSPEFQPGDIIIVDPEVAPMPGDYVVARIDGDDSATFKKYRSRGADGEGFNTFELVPLNADYATILVNTANPGKIVGTMVEHRRKRRRR